MSYKNNFPLRNAIFEQCFLKMRKPNHYILILILKNV